MDWPGPQWTATQQKITFKIVSPQACLPKWLWFICREDLYIFFKCSKVTLFNVCTANIAMSCSDWAQEASLCYWERVQEPFESTCLLCRHWSFMMHRYVLSACFLACFGSPGLSGKARLGGKKRPGALCSKQHITWPRPVHSSMLQQTSGDAYNHTHSCMHTHSHTVNTFLPSGTTQCSLDWVSDTEHVTV